MAVGPVVRRLTGGGAIWHHHELTYALILPAGHPRARPNTALYRAVHSAIAETLAEVGLSVNRGNGVAARATGEGLRPFLCFTDRNPEDLVYQGFKLVGSAQRRRSGAILQQGSILLAASPHLPELRGCSDLAVVSRSCDDWSGLLRNSIASAWGWNWKPSPFRRRSGNGRLNWSPPYIAQRVGLALANGSPTMEIGRDRSAEKSFGST